MRTILWGAALGIAAVLASGCASSDDTGGAGGGPGGLGGGGATGGTGGVAGTGGASGTGGTAGSGGTAGTANGGTGAYAGADAGAFVPVNAQSCAITDGGALLCNGESCCTSLVVPGGTFPQGRSNVGSDQCPAGTICDPGEQPEHPSTVSTFAMDKYEITVGRFRKFVDAYVDNTTSAPADGAGANPNIPGTGWQSAWNTSLPATKAELLDATHISCAETWHTWTDSPGTAEQENRALNCVDWYEAFAFCIWDGGRLATESEWEYAAAGGSENRLYPWGSAAPTASLAVFGCQDYPGGRCVFLPVGSTLAGNGKWGHADLAGNAWEWTFDWYAAYSASAKNNYANTTVGAGRAFRGGAAYSDISTLTATYRVGFSAEQREYSLGARCSRTVQ